MLRQYRMHRINFIRGDINGFRLHRGIEELMGIILTLSIGNISN
jgi:hypothetical protein